MYAVIGRVKIKPGHEQETLAMIEKSGVAMVSGFPGSRGGYWAHAVDGEDLIQHSFWLFDGEEGARAAEATYQMLRAMPDAPATLISVEVCEVVGLGVAHRQPPKRASRAESGAVGRLWRQPARAVNAHFPYPAAGLPRAAGPCRED
ncbi:MAG: hypothetical protein E6G09_02325 [Actinobacteria bacterium]|nr:MAG: hypothetical protein E6G09_02325 [Actinomycetota bacterium]